MLGSIACPCPWSLKFLKAFQYIQELTIQPRALHVRVISTPSYIPLLYSKTGIYRGIHFFLFLLYNIDCGYSFEPAVTAKLISAFVFATWIVQFLFYLNPKFQASSHLLWLHSPVCVGPGRKPRRPVFSERGSYNKISITHLCNILRFFIAVKKLIFRRNKLELKNE